MQPHSSIQLRSRTLDHGGPFRYFLAHELRELLRRAADEIVTAATQSFFRRLGDERFIDFRVEPRDDRPRHTGRHDDSAPRRHFEPGNACLGYGWQLRY